MKPGRNGFLVPPDDPVALGEAMLKVIKDPVYQSRLGRGSLELVAGHSEEVTFQAYEKLYQGMTAHR